MTTYDIIFLSFSSDDGYGQQCCYGNNSILVKGQPSGGSPDEISPVNNYYGHVFLDLLPYIICCKNVEFPQCQTYYNGRPYGNEMDYTFPKPG